MCRKQQQKGLGPNTEQVKFNELFGNGKLTGNKTGERQNLNINLTGKRAQSKSRNLKT